MDDGSKDTSAEIAKSLAGSGDQVIVQGKNQLNTAAVIAGIAAARGEIIAIQDADLEYDPNDLPLG